MKGSLPFEFTMTNTRLTIDPLKPVVDTLEGYQESLGLTEPVEEESIQPPKAIRLTPEGYQKLLDMIENPVPVSEEARQRVQRSLKRLGLK